MSRSSESREIAERVAEVLAVAEWRSEEGLIESVCADKPHLIERVTEAVELAEALPGLHQLGLPEDERIGARLGGRYEIQRRIGSGAMGVVYAATDDELGRDVAVKVMHAGLLGRAKALARFEREVAALAAIRHDAVIQIHDRGVTEDLSPFLVMELIDGVPLSDILALAPKSGSALDSVDWLEADFGIEVEGERSFVRVMLRWGADLAAGLASIHANGVIHRDVKPSNILIRRDGSVILLDFGIAAVDELEPLTRTSEAVGTPAYMAPEALKGSVAKPAALDVYGLAATLYHGVTLHAPYSGSPSDIFTALATREPVRAVKVRPGLPVDVQAILDAGLARTVQKRYPSAAALEDDLRAHLAYRPVSVRPVSPTARLVGSFVRSRAAWSALAVALVALALWGYAGLKETRAEEAKVLSESLYLAHPANLTIVSPANRRTLDPDAREEIKARLTRLIDANHQPVIFRALRAAYCADQGEFELAASDAAANSRSIGGPVAKQLTALYAGLSDANPAISRADVDGLPEPKGGLGSFLLALHALRVGDLGKSEVALDHEELDGIRYVEEMRFVFDLIVLAALRQSNDDEAVAREGGRVLREIEGLEARFGSRSAQSAHLLSTVLTVVERWRDCIAITREGAALSSLTHVTLQNGARAAERLGASTVAIELAEQALKVVPGYLPLVQVRAKALSKSGAWIGARSYVEQEFARAGKADTDAFHLLVARLFLDEAVVAYQLDRGRAVGCAQGMIETLASVPSDYAPRRALVSLAEAIIARDSDPVFTYLLGEVQRAPDDRGALALAMKFQPESLDSQQAALVLKLLVAMSDTMFRPSQVVTYRPSTLTGPTRPDPTTNQQQADSPTPSPLQATQSK